MKIIKSHGYYKENFISVDCPTCFSNENEFCVGNDDNRTVPHLCRIREATAALNDKKRENILSIITLFETSSVAVMFATIIQVFIKNNMEECLKVLIALPALYC